MNQVASIDIGEWAKRADGNWRSKLTQYNDRTRRWSTNLRLNWLRTAANGLYVVYNDTEAFSGLGPVNRTFIVKYSHLLDVLQ